MNDVVMGPKQDGKGSGYVLVHTGSKHMAADIYTKSFTDKATFGNLKQLINVFKPEQIKDGNFDPSIPGEVVPPDCQGWLNQHYHFLLSGDNTEVTDFRKPIKQKTPKAKSKLNMALRKIRPNLNRRSMPEGSLSAVLSDDESSDEEVPVTGGVDLPRFEFEKGSPCLPFTTSLVNCPTLGNDAVPAEADNSPSKDDTTWTIILLCTEKDSLMVKHNPFGERCKIVEITEHDDFTSEGGYQKVVDALRSPNVVIFSSLPCTGGSLWQIPNKKHPACRRLIAKHHKLFNALFEKLLRLYREVDRRGGIPILFEWPRTCRYWRKPKVARFIKRQKLTLAKFDGCAY